MVLITAAPIFLIFRALLFREMQEVLVAEMSVSADHLAILKLLP
jgi:hypothetical protein